MKNLYEEISSIVFLIAFFVPYLLNIFQLIEIQSFDGIALVKAVGIIVFPLGWLMGIVGMF